MESDWGTNQGMPQGSHTLSFLTSSSSQPLAFEPNDNIFKDASRSISHHDTCLAAIFGIPEEPITPSTSTAPQISNAPLTLTNTLHNVPTPAPSSPFPSLGEVSPLSEQTALYQLMVRSPSVGSSTNGSPGDGSTEGESASDDGTQNILGLESWDAMFDSWGMLPFPMGGLAQPETEPSASTSSSLSPPDSYAGDGLLPASDISSLPSFSTMLSQQQGSGHSALHHQPTYAQPPHPTPPYSLATQPQTAVTPPTQSSTANVQSHPRLRHTSGAISQACAVSHGPAPQLGCGHYQCDRSLKGHSHSSDTPPLLSPPYQSPHRRSPSVTSPPPHPPWYHSPSDNLSTPSGTQGHHSTSHERLFSTPNPTLPLPPSPRFGHFSARPLMTQRDSSGQWRVYASPEGEAVPWPTNLQPLIVIPSAPPGADPREWTRQFWTEGRKALASMDYQTRRSVATFTDKMEGEQWGRRHDQEGECVQEEYNVLPRSPENGEGSPVCVKRVKSASTGLSHAHSFTQAFADRFSSPPPSSSSRRIFTTPPRLRHPSLSSVISPEDAPQRGFDMTRHGSLASVTTFMSTPGQSSPKKRRASETKGDGLMKAKGEKTSPREWVRVCEWIDAKVAEDGCRSSSQLSRDACDHFDSLPEDQSINLVANTCRSHYTTSAQATRKHESLAYGSGKNGSLLDIINQERRALGFAPLTWHCSPTPPLGSLNSPQLDEYGSIRPDTGREIQHKFSRLDIDTQQKIINEADSRRWARAILAEPKVTVDQRMRMNLWVDEQRPLYHWAENDAAQAVETYFRDLPEPHRIISSHAYCFLALEGRQVLEHMALKRCSLDDRHTVLQSIVAAETEKLRAAEKAMRRRLPPSTPPSRDSGVPGSSQRDRSSGDFGDVSQDFVDPRMLWRMSLEPEDGV